MRLCQGGFGGGSSCAFLDHEYTFSRGGRLVGQVSKRWYTLSDTYGVQIEAGADDVLVLASVVVIDLACHDNRNRQ